MVHSKAKLLNHLPAIVRLVHLELHQLMEVQDLGQQPLVISYRFANRYELSLKRFHCLPAFISDLISLLCRFYHFHVR